MAEKHPKLAGHVVASFVNHSPGDRWVHVVGQSKPTVLVKGNGGRLNGATLTDAEYASTLGIEGFEEVETAAPGAEAEGGEAKKAAAKKRGK